MSDWVYLQVFGDLVTTELVRGILSSEGIESHIRDEHARYLGSVKDRLYEPLIAVRRADEERARQILREFQKSMSESASSEDALVE
mgnify:CR=1 FL=1